MNAVSVLCVAHNTGPGRKARRRAPLIAISWPCHSIAMVEHDSFFTLISGTALVLIGFGFARSRAIRFVRLAGLLAMIYGVYMVLAVTHMIR